MESNPLLRPVQYISHRS